VESGEASVAVEAGAIAIATGHPSATLGVAAAKIRAGEAAAIAHQVHGAIGFTLEHGLHRLTRRSWSWRDELGTESRRSRELGREEVHVQAEPPNVIRCSDLVNCHRNPRKLSGVS
jgi:acyl-CoA dehydrogenase